jgi:hypothetical protein
MNALLRLLFWWSGDAGDATPLQASVSAEATASLGLSTAITPAAAVTAEATAACSLSTAITMAADAAASATATCDLFTDRVTRLSDLSGRLGVERVAGQRHVARRAWRHVGARDARRVVRVR